MAPEWKVEMRFKHDNAGGPDDPHPRRCVRLLKLELAREARPIYTDNALAQLTGYDCGLGLALAGINKFLSED